ncbi:unnamed protein product [Chrysoparadoxa australica]
MRVKALYDYTAQERDELSLVKGEILTVLAVDPDGDGWWKGKNNRGGEGVFPGNYVREEKLVPQQKLGYAQALPQQQGFSPQSLPDTASDGWDGFDSGTAEGPLPEGWFQALDEGTGTPYYYTNEGQSTWHRPKGGRGQGLIGGGGGAGLGARRGSIDVIKQELDRTERERRGAERLRKQAEQEVDYRIRKADAMHDHLIGELEEQAALQIQAAARGHRDRARVSSMRSEKKGVGGAHDTATRISNNVMETVAGELGPALDQGTARLIARLVEGKVEDELRRRDDLLVGVQSSLNQLQGHVRQNPEALRGVQEAKRSLAKLGRPATTRLGGVMTRGAAGGSGVSLPSVSGSLSPARSLPSRSLPSLSPVRSRNGFEEGGGALPSVGAGGAAAGAGEKLQIKTMQKAGAQRYPECRTVVYSPTGHVEGQVDCTAPSQSLRLEYVHGYSGEMAKGYGMSRGANVLWLHSGELIFPASNLVIIHDYQQNRQRFFSRHDEAVTALAVHPQQDVVASGQICKKGTAVVCLTDATGAGGDHTGPPELLSELSAGPGSKGVSSLEFSPDGELLLILAADVTQTVSVWDWQSRQKLVAAAASASKLEVQGIHFNRYLCLVGQSLTDFGGPAGQNRYTLVSCGHKHVKFWTLNKSPLQHQEAPHRFRGEKATDLPKWQWTLQGGAGTFGRRGDICQITCMALVPDSPGDPVARSLPTAWVLTGTELGQIYVWLVAEEENGEEGQVALGWRPHGKLVAVLQNCHEGMIVNMSMTTAKSSSPVEAASRPLLATCGIDGTLKVWAIADTSLRMDATYSTSSESQTSSFLDNLMTVQVSSRGPAMGWPRSVAWDYEGKTLALGTTGNAVCLVQPGDALHGGEAAKNVMFMMALSGHTGSLKAIASHPKRAWVISAGSDRTVRLWDVQLRRLLSMAKLHDHATAVTFHPGGDIVAVGTEGGDVLIMSLKTGGGKDGKGITWEVLARKRPSKTHNQSPDKAKASTLGTFSMAKRDMQQSVRLHRTDLLNRSEPDTEDLLPHANGNSRKAKPPADINVLRFSPDGSMLAVGSRDTHIYLYRMEEGYLQRHTTCRGHSTGVRHLDFSQDSAHLQSTDANRELLFWYTHSGKLASQSSALCDTQWATWTCPLGWPVQGVWGFGHRKDAEAVEVTAVARSHRGDVLVTADDAHFLTLAKFPCLVNAVGKEARDIRGHVEEACFLFDDSCVSTASLDGCTCQWSVTTGGGGYQR